MCCSQLLAARSIAGVSAADPSTHVQLEPAPAAASAARRFVAEHADGVAPDARATLALLTSELVTNGVLHARTPLVVGVTRGSSRLLVTVADDSDVTPQQPPADDNRPSGRGLLLVDAMSAEWGVHRHGGAKTVWFTVAAGGAGAEEAAQ